VKSVYTLADQSQVAKFFRMTVARDGVEPPPPAFSGLRTTSLFLPFFDNLTLQSGPVL
jgi:hypothetical protein